MERPSVNPGPPVLVETATVEFWSVPSHTTPGKSYIVQLYNLGVPDVFVLECNCPARISACVHVRDVVELKEDKLNT